MKKKVILLSSDDNVITAVLNLEKGQIISTQIDDKTYKIKLKEKISFGHKIALKSIKSGQKIKKYGEVIGEATCHIEPGEWVHTHNMKSLRTDIL